MFYSFWILNEIMLPRIDPKIKLDPMIKLTGSSIVSSNSKSTSLLFELFWIPINKSINKHELKIAVKNNFFIKKLIYLNLNIINFKSSYKFRFFLHHVSLLNI